MPRRERRRVGVEVMRQEGKMMQRLWVEKVKSICWGRGQQRLGGSGRSVNGGMGRDGWEGCTFIWH